MKKFRSRIAIILTMVMVLTSFTFLGVYADDDPTAPSAVTGLAAYSSSEAVVFLWDKATNEDGSEDTTVKYLVNGNPVTPTTYKGKNRFDITGIGEGGYASATVVAYREKTTTTTTGEGEEATSVTTTERLESSPVSAADNAVQTIRYRVRIKKGGTLKSHGGPSRSIRVSKGQYIYAYGFGGGKYIFKDGDSIFYCNKSRTNKRSCVYNSGATYSPMEAEFFINARGLGSGTGSFVWCNTYSQTIYRFSGSAGNWTCQNYFKCSTGKAATPSPTGVSGRKTIWKKIKKRHGIKWWSPYSDINSFHSKKAKWTIGAPTSNGCIRNYEANAYDLYVNAPIGTAVLLY